MRKLIFCKNLPQVINQIIIITILLIIIIIGSNVVGSANDFEGQSLGATQEKCCGRFGLHTLHNNNKHPFRHHQQGTLKLTTTWLIMNCVRNSLCFRLSVQKQKQHRQLRTKLPMLRIENLGWLILATGLPRCCDILVCRVTNGFLCYYFPQGTLVASHLETLILYALTNLTFTAFHLQKFYINIFIFKTR